MMIEAKKLRDKAFLRTIPNDKPGIYKWFCKKNEFNLIADKLKIKTNDIFNSLEIKDSLYCIYVGIAVKESIMKRLNWHVNDKHSLSKVKNGTLSTLRQSISSIVSNNQSDKAGTNKFIDKLFICFETYNLEIKSKKAVDTIHSKEKEILSKNLYILNIQENNHPLAKPIKKELKALRKTSKAKALK